MQWWNEFRRRLRVLFHRARFERELEEEMRCHLQMQSEEAQLAGATAEEAACSARRRFGNPTLLRETSRETWSFASLEQWAQDIRYAVRQLSAAKGFTLTATLTLALGIGANTGIFTLVDALMLRSLPVADPKGLVRIGAGDNCCVLGGLQGDYSVYSYPLYTYLRDHSPEIRDMAAFQAGTRRSGVRRAGADDAHVFASQFVSGNYFALFGLRPFAGRLIGPADDRPGASPVAVISYRLWQQHYHGDPSVVGGSFLIGGAPVTVVGIAPQGFFGAELRPDPPDFWMPLAAEPAARGTSTLLHRAAEHWLYVFGRLQPGAPPETVEAALNVRLKQWLLASDAPGNDRERQAIEQQRLALAPGGAGVSHRENYADDLRLLLGITALVLLIACANLANLQLTRGVAASAQTSIRVALGAPRGRLIRQVLIECAIISLLGGLAGLLVASATARLLFRISLSHASFVPIDTTPSPLALGFAFALSVTTALLFGLAPAWSASRADPAVALHGAGRSASSRSMVAQKALVVLQAALSLVLLAGAGLMAQTLRNLTNQQFGYRLDGTMVANVVADVGEYPPEKLSVIYSELERRMHETPGVRNAALALYSPMSGNNWQMNATLESRPHQPINPSWNRVSPGFFDAIGARILRGRGFDERDTPGSTRVAVVNQAFADKWYPNQDPVGKRFGLGGYENRADYTIVGVVNTIRFRNPRAPFGPMFFLPLLQMTKSEWEDNMRARSNVIQSIVLHVDRAPQDFAERVQRAVGTIDSNLAMLNMFTADEMLGFQLSRERMIGVLAQVFGVLALLLASVGLYGMTAYSVARRTSEIGVRTALGATRGQIFRLVLKGALAQTALGAAIGAPVALVSGRLIGSYVYGVRTSDPTVLVLSSVVLAGCAAIAAAVPALRAIGVDPVTALRTE